MKCVYSSENQSQTWNMETPSTDSFVCVKIFFASETVASRLQLYWSDEKSEEEKDEPTLATAASE